MIKQCKFLQHLSAAAPKALWSAQILSVPPASARAWHWLGSAPRPVQPQAAAPSTGRLWGARSLRPCNAADKSAAGCSAGSENLYLQQDPGQSQELLSERSSERNGTPAHSGLPGHSHAISSLQQPHKWSIFIIRSWQRWRWVSFMFTLNSDFPRLTTLQHNTI